MLAGGLDQLSAQSRRFKKKTVNLINYYYRPLHFGFQIGGYTAFTRFTYQNSFISGSGNENDKFNTLTSIESVASPGFLIGFILNINLGKEKLDLRFMPNFALYTREFEFRYSDRETETQTVEESYIELPIMIKYKSARRLNRRMYVQSGLVSGFQLGGKGTPKPEELGLKNFNMELAFGIGMHSYMQYFNFAPEVRFSIGLLNMIQTTEGLGQRVKSITPYKITFLLNFEG